MRVLFAGSPDFAVPSLGAVHPRLEVCGVLTCCTHSTGRGRAQSCSPVAFRAAALGLPVIEADTIDAGVLEKIASLRPDILAVSAYGRIFRKSFIALFPRGGINLHPSLLPRHRGPSPVAAAILEGDAETGVTVQRLAMKFDTGDVLARSVVPLCGRETCGELTETLARIGAELFTDVLYRLSQGDFAGTPQDESRATYCRLIRKEDGVIDWSAPAVRIERAVRAFDPWPRAFTRYDGLALLILKARVVAGEKGGEPGRVLGFRKDAGLLVQTGDGLLAVEALQLQARKPLDARAFLNGNPRVVGSRFGGDP
jgi:methionyl-tRNA formyltransferase